MASFVGGALRVGKRLLARPGVRPRNILFGEFRGIRMNIDASRQTQLLLGLFEREVYGWLRRLTRGIRAAIDLGAEEGEYTIYLLQRTGAQRVISVEPLPASLDALLANLRLNFRDLPPHLTIVPQNIGTADWRRPLSLRMLAADLPRPLFIKLDADGSEVDILQSAGDLLADSEIRWLIETHSLQLERDTIQLFQDHGRAPLIIHNAKWRRWLPEQRITHNRWLVVS